MRPALGIPIGVAVALAGTRATAQAPGDRPPRLALDLDVVFGKGARLCPDPATLHRELARRLGYDAFEPDGPSTPAGRLNVRIAAAGNGLAATFEWLEPDGKSRWPAPRTVHEEGTDEIACTDLFKSIAVEIVWEFPLPARPAQPAAAPPLPACQAVPVPECAKAPPAVAAGKLEPVAAAKAEPAAVAAPRVWQVGVGPWVDFGLAPRPLVGVKVEGGVRRGWWSVMGEVRWDPTASAIGLDGVYLPSSAGTSLLAGSFFGCWHRDWHASFDVCAVGELGQMQRGFRTAMVGGLQEAAIYAGGGAGARVGIPLPARLHVDIVATVRGVRRLRTNDDQALDATTGSVGALAGGLGADLGYSF